MEPKFLLKSVIVSTALVALIAAGYAQVAAPTTLPNCLIEFTSMPAAMYSASHLVLYNSDQTFIELSNSYTSPIAPGHSTEPLSQGAYTYAVDPKDPTHATITYSAGDLGSDQLYFRSSTAGLQAPFAQFTPGGLPQPSFTLYPYQGATGATNVSNRFQWNAGGTNITGFVVQSQTGGPRWVLIRALGMTLGNFGVSPTVAKPAITLFDSTATVVGSSSTWSADPNLVPGFQSVFNMVGACPLINGSDEGVLLLPLNPGAYTLSFTGGSTGQALCEVYLLPF